MCLKAMQLMRLNHAQDRGDFSYRAPQPVREASREPRGRHEAGLSLCPVQIMDPVGALSLAMGSHLAAGIRGA